MDNRKIIVTALTVFIIMSSLTIATLTVFPAFIPVVTAESNAPPDNGTTTNVWYIDKNDQVLRDNESLSTVDIQINSTGAMDWDNITCEITGDIFVRDGGFFNATNSYLTLKGDLIINGTVNFNNVILIMNSTFDGEFEILVNSNSTFNVDYSNITAYNIWTPINLDSNIADYESWGYHYNFTVYGNMSMSHCDVSYVWGRTVVIGTALTFHGGIVIAPTNNSIVTVTYSNITKMEMIAFNLQGWTHDITISHNNIYEISNLSTWYGFGIYASPECNATVSYNTITNCTANGIFSFTDSNCTIIDNDITFCGNMTTWQFRSGILCWLSGPKILDNEISDNFGVAGVFIIQSSSDCVVDNNTIFNNDGAGVQVVSSDSILENNYVHNNTGNGIEIYGWIQIGLTPYIWPSNGKIENNTIEFNNQTGVYYDNDPPSGTPSPISTVINNSVIKNNTIDGIYALRCTPPITNNTIYNNDQHGIYLNQRSDSFVYNNTILNNANNGIYSVQSSPNINENNISYNNWDGIACPISSSPDISFNYISYNNYSGIYLDSNSDANIVNNDIQDNNWSGIDTLRSSPTIRTNNVTSNNLSGIRIYGSGTGTIVIRDNEITYNLENGIECESTSPVIRTNNVTNNTMNGLRLNNSSPIIYDNNLIMYNQEHGIACYSGSAPTIKNDLKFNTLSGLYCNASSPVIQNVMISNNSNGIYTDAGSAPSIENSTITGNTVNAFRLGGNSHPLSLNTTFNGTRVYFEDTRSTLSVQWFLNLKTVDEHDAPLGICDVEVNSTTQTPSGIWAGRTRGDGLVLWLHVTEYVKTDNNGNNDALDAGETTTWTPHNISADKFGYSKSYADPEPTIDHSMWVTIKLGTNKRPTPVSNIKPDSTHSLSPDLSWDPSTDGDGQPLTYYVNLGTYPNGTDLLFNQSTTQTSYLLTLPEDFDDGNITYYVLIFADDNDGGFSRVNDEFYLINNVPTQPGINITPKSPNTLYDSLTCHINTSSMDLDGDEVNYTYKWYKNGVLQNDLIEANTKALSDTISASGDGFTFRIDDVWMCRVTANDGFMDSSRAEDWVEFINLLPTANSIENLIMDEDAQELDWINLSNVFVDPDPPEEGTPFIFWVVGNENITVTIGQDGTVDIMPIANWNGEETITFWANDTGNKVKQVSAEAEIIVLPVNDEPKLVSVKKIDVDDSRFISFEGTKGATQNFAFIMQVVVYDKDLELGEVDTLLFSTNSSRVTVLPDPTNNPLKINLSFVPDNSDASDKYLFIRLELKDINDEMIDDYVDIKIEIRNINDPPLIESFTHVKSDITYDVTIIGDKEQVTFTTDENCAYEDEWFNLTVNGNDIDLYDVISFDSDDKRFLIKTDQENKFIGLVSFNPSQADVGAIEFNVTVTDSEGATDTVSVKVLVKNINDPPKAKTPLRPKLREFKVGETIDFEGAFEDEDLPLDSHTYSWASDLDGPLGDTLILENVELSTGVHEITFTVKDSAQKEDSITITITVGGEDTDRDELPDSWEIQHFNGLEYGADDDPDNDHYTNLEEYLGDFDPNDPNSPVPQTEPKESKAMDDALLYGIIIVIVIIIIIVLALFFVIRKRKSAPEEASPPAAGAAIPIPQPIQRPDDAKEGYHARPAPTIEELFPEGIKEEDLALIGKPPEPEKESKAEKERTAMKKKTSTGIGLPPEELKKELRKEPSGKGTATKGRMDKDRSERQEQVIMRPEADDEKISERYEDAKEFRPVEEPSEDFEMDIPDSPFGAVKIKEIGEASEEPIFMEREPETLLFTDEEEESEDETDDDEE